MVAHAYPQLTARRQVAFAISAQLAGAGGSHSAEICRRMNASLGAVDSATQARAISAFAQSLADQIELVLEGYNDQVDMVLAIRQETITTWICLAINEAVAAAGCP